MTPTPDRSPVATRSLEELVAASVRVIAAGQAPSGGYVASPTFPTYRYSWIRDGAFIADAMSRVGHHDSADRFHGWCAGIVAARRGLVEDLMARAGTDAHPGPTEHLRTRYTLDGQDADGFWENFQLDGYGTWLWSLVIHLRRTARPAVHVEEVALIVRYLATFWAEPSYDWWEEHLDQVHTSTLVSIWAGLEAAAGWPALPAAVRGLAATTAADIRARVEAEAIVDGALTKWLGSDAVDGSLIACLTPFGFYGPDHPVAVRTVGRVEAELAPAGVYRYQGDVYYGGGQWILLTAFLAWHHLRAGDTGRARELIGWIAAQADADGHLPEQVADTLLAPDHLRPWEDRWGPSANPLLWSHAMLIDVACELGIAT